MSWVAQRWTPGLGYEIKLSRDGLVIGHAMRTLAQIWFGICRVCDTQTGDNADRHAAGRELAAHFTDKHGEPGS